MKLINIEVTGLKLYDKTHSFNFGKVNHILGDRGKGKTAISESIVWCLKGCDLTGSTRGIKKRHKNKATKEMSVVTLWEFPHSDGTTIRHQFSRVSQGKSTLLYLDNMIVDQADFDNIIGPTDILLSVFSPGYIGGITAPKVRNVILSLLSNQDHQNVIESLSDEEQIRLSHIDMIDPLSSLQQLKNDLVECNEYLGGIETSMASLRMAAALNGDSATLMEERRVLTTLKDELETLKLMEGPTEPEQLTIWNEERATLGIKYQEYVERWKRLKSEPLLGVNLAAETREREAELHSLSVVCQGLLDKGFIVRNRIDLETKHYELDLAEFQEHKIQQMQELQIDINQMEAKQSVRKRNEKIIEGMPRLQKHFDEGAVERERVRNDIHSVQNFMIRYAETQVEEANLYLNHAEILFTSRREHEGDITLHYKLLFKKKEYYTLTSSDKIRCSFELSTLVNKVQGRLIPVFVDNGESTEEFIESETQFFVTSIIPSAALSSEVVVA